MQKFLQTALIVGTGVAASSSAPGPVSSDAAASASSSSQPAGDVQIDGEKSILGNVQLEQVGGSSSSTAPVDGVRVTDEGVQRRLRGEGG